MRIYRGNTVSQIAPQGWLAIASIKPHIQIDVFTFELSLMHTWILKQYYYVNYKSSYAQSHNK